MPSTLPDGGDDAPDGARNRILVLSSLAERDSEVLACPPACA